MKSKKMFSTSVVGGLLTVIFATLISGSNVMAADLDQQVADIKAKNEAYRNMITGKNFGDGWGAKQFGVTDVDNDGIAELIVNVSSDGNPSTILSWQNGNIVWGYDSWLKSELYYSPKTGNIMSIEESNTVKHVYVGRFDVTANGGFNFIIKTKISEAGNYQHEVLNENNEFTGYKDFTEEETADMNAQMNNYMPSRVLLTSPYDITTENMDTYLPIDETKIKEDLQSNGDNSTIISENNNNIFLTDYVNILDNNSRFISSELTEGDKYDKAQQLLSGLSNQSVNSHVIDFTVMDSAGVAVSQLSGKVKVVLPLPANMNANNEINVYRLNEVNNQLILCETSVSNNEITFATDHFSIFIVAETQKESNNTNDNNNNNNNNTPNDNQNSNNEVNTDVATEKSADLQSPKTGDYFNVFIPVFLIILSASTIMILLRRVKKA